ncbi:MAG: class I SAM-dependent methyltransferase [Candidatus Binatus sp.]|jgi:2-polyprenyl-3-methyl-5-hydroxy-6-metoxy-1,4-benzoquinol methylase|uniref:class I SAM-dependent DNA methyltransferase n=1 Tax=Candidatus Binatus sp. TaxID=2811406 RepID=UPI003CBDAE84
MSDGGTEYRGRLYGRYVSSRSEAPAPDTLDGLRPRAPYLRKLIRDHFPPERDAAIVDLGCGHGALIHFARQAGYRNLEGMDGSHEQVAAAKRLGIDGVREGDLRESLAAMPDASRDAVVSFDVVEHFRKDELLSFVDEVRRVLRPGGRWIIHTVNGESPFFGRIRYGDFTHEMAFTRESMSQLLLSSGFERVQCFEDTPVPHGVKSSVRWLLWKGIRGGLRLWLAVETGDSGRSAIFTQNLLAVATK